MAVDKGIGRDARETSVPVRLGILYLRTLPVPPAFTLSLPFHAILIVGLMQKIAEPEHFPALVGARCGAFLDSELQSPSPITFFPYSLPFPAPFFSPLSSPFSHSLPEKTESYVMKKRLMDWWNLVKNGSY